MAKFIKGNKVLFGNVNDFSEYFLISYKVEYKKKILLEELDFFKNTILFKSYKKIKIYDFPNKKGETRIKKNLFGDFVPEKKTNARQSVRARDF
jgi:hypothetical protein